ncbi:MAG: hypothetical protein EBV82_08970, partial [Chitinophagia bacterium]|nr:hypothetical protein [Chitinophagia bacterium]
LKTIPENQQITVKGWVRTFRNNSFIALNDGSTNNNLQVVVDFTSTSEEVLKRITTGAAISVNGILIASLGKGQVVEVKATTIEILGDSDAEKYPLQPKKHSLEFLREIAHLRFRTNTFGAVFRVRNSLAFAIHKFFNEKGFLYIHTPIITSSDADNVFCEGSSITFKAIPINGGSAPIYQWRKNGINISGANSSVLTMNNLQNGDDIDVVMVSNFMPTNCLVGSPAFSNIITNVVNTNLMPSVIIKSNDSDNVICSGTNVTFSSAIINGGNLPFYQWRLNGNNIGLNAPTLTLNSIVDGDVISLLMTSNATPCLSFTNALSNLIPIKVLTSNVTASANKTNICYGDTIILKGSGAVNYIWDNNVIDSKPFVPTITTTYNILGTDSNGCKNTASVTIKVNPLPLAEYIKSSSNKLMAQGTMLLTGYASMGKPPYSYHWKTDPTKASVIDNVNPTNLTGISPGNIALSFYVIDANGCSSNISELLTMEIVPTEMKFEVPNAFLPFANFGENRYLKASFNFAVKNVNYFKIYNRTGQLVYQLLNKEPSAIQWDGKLNGNLQEADGYVWIAEITGLGTPSLIHKSGQFLLLK